MKNEHLKPYEKAARILCKKHGIDPDDKMLMPNPAIPSMLKEIPRWHGAAEELIDLSMKLTALREASEPEPTVN